MNLKTIVRKECCFLLQESRKTEVLIEMMERIHAEGLVEDLDTLKKEIFYREQLMSTGIGMGIGIPHVRFRGVTDPIVAVGVRKEGIHDYDSIDQIPVGIVIMILVGEDQHKEHIRLLSQIMGRLKSTEMRENILEAVSGEALYDLLMGDSDD